MNIFKDTGKTQSAMYRPDIDGLRAVAVLLVLFFHAGFEFFSGGYVGVDVFFVISGFLITGILISSIEKNKYSFKIFIFSRITRLYPALISTVIITIIIGFLVFTPSDYINLGKTAIYTIASVSNFYFWMKSGYFDTSSETNPLLHTWSLSVEQQFYLIWPLILVLAMKLGRKGVLYTILAFGLVSLGFSEAFVKIDPTSNYYLMPFRIFEFAAGGVLALRRSGDTKMTVAHDIGFLIGVALILFAAITYGKATAFPGIHALVPTIGACLCILCGGQSRASYIVRNTAVVSIGIVSYSIYLVHWPVLVFYKYYIYRPITDAEKISLILVSIALGFASYVLIENRFRKINLASINKMSASFLLSLTAICTASFIIIGKSGFEFRVNDYFREKIDNAQEMHFQLYGGAGYYFGSYDIGDKEAAKPVAVLMGDSYARQYAWSMDKRLQKEGRKIVTAFQDGCWFSATHTTIEGGKPKTQCVEMFNKAVELSNTYNIPIIWGMSWLGNYEVTGTLDGSPREFKDHDDFLRFAKSDVSDLLSKIKSRVLILGIPTGAAGASGIASCIERPDYLPLSCAEYLTTPVNNSFTWDVNSFFDRLSKGNDRLLFIDPNDALCSKGMCSTMTQDNQFIYSDSAHLSRTGTDVVLNRKWRDIESIF
ncbi:acyltransferase family protein [Atlantibacter sp.]|uniref:acyltransferase family protein n=1 Tax=Atlantibacter sp. TaxID=1903473 RepID=UPI00289E02BA|nr:acyltransferase family protein [Atlantibacter sp.]